MRFLPLVNVHDGLQVTPDRRLEEKTRRRIRIGRYEVETQLEPQAKAALQSPTDLAQDRVEEITNELRHLPAVTQRALPLLRRRLVA